ncbi:MAG: beta-lactamase family protein [Verrucomicrobia bacterium]|nr:beta-lactamase family protein [Verrucomicrobiota bacterium]
MKTVVAFSPRNRWLLLPLFVVAAFTLSAKPALTDVFRQEKLAAIDAAITNAIAEKRLPGAVLWLERDGVAYRRAYGQRAVTPKPEAMTEDTIFDLASLTKVVATAPCVMRLIEDGKVKLDAPVREYIPEFRRDGKDAITVRQLLTHTSGLRSGLGRSVNGPNAAISFACQEKTNSVPGTAFVYSDINFILLGELVQRVSHTPLAEFAEEVVYRPLKMRETGYSPTEKLSKRIAPTVGRERGEVHDPTSFGMGGVAGHAGVFGTAADLARYCRMMLNEGELDGQRILKPETVRMMTSVQSPDTVRTRRGLGWDIDSGYSRRGTVFPLGSFGHTGFTGTCLWLDPFSKTFVVLLSNRVHPDGKGDIRSLQTTVATLAAEAVIGFDFTNVVGALPSRTNSPATRQASPSP